MPMLVLLLVELGRIDQTIQRPDHFGSWKLEVGNCSDASNFCWCFFSFGGWVFHDQLRSIILTRFFFNVRPSKTVRCTHTRRQERRPVSIPPHHSIQQRLGRDLHQKGTPFDVDLQRPRRIGKHHSLVGGGLGCVLRVRRFLSSFFLFFFALSFFSFFRFFRSFVLHVSIMFQSFNPLHTVRVDLLKF